MPRTNPKKSTKVIEEEVIVTARDGKNIYTTIGHPKGKPKGMVIFVHGLASTELWPTMLLGSWYFRKRGYAYCRVSLYHWKPKARTLMRSDLKQHGKDVDDVVRHLRRLGYSNLYAIGHSFGGLSLLVSNTGAFSALSLWDCSSLISYPPTFWFAKDKTTGATFMKGSYELFVSNRYRRGIETFPNELKLINKITAPCQICYAAGKSGVLIESSKRYYAHLNSEKELVAIPNASHSFTEEGISNQLFKSTEKWFRKQRRAATQ